MKQQSRLSSLPDEVRKQDRAKASLRKSDNDESTVRNSDRDDETQRLAAELFDEALNDPRCALTSDEVAFLLGVSRSLVDKWREPSAPNCPSFIQLLRLPLKFQLALNRALDRRFGYGRAALGDLIAAAGSIAVSLER